MRNLDRRKFLQIILSSSVIALSGCKSSYKKSIFRATSSSIPRIWLEDLPSEWIYREIKANAHTDRLFSYIDSVDDLISIGDGWINEIPKDFLKPIDSYDFSALKSKKSIKFIEKLKPKLRNKVLPIGFSPWVMLFRNGDKWLNRANESWDVLLEEDLRGKIVFPSSKRIVIDISKKLKWLIH